MSRRWLFLVANGGDVRDLAMRALAARVLCKINGAAKPRHREINNNYEREIAQAITASMPLVSTIYNSFAAAPLGCFSAEGDSHF